MQLCDSHHQEVCYNGRDCPVCEAIAEKEVVESELELTKQSLEATNEAVEALRSEIEELKNVEPETSRPPRESP
jgi:hypothetical protein